MKSIPRTLRGEARDLPPRDGKPVGEKGSALLISMLLMVILTLLGISYLLLAQTESQIAENQLAAQQALFVAESGARMVIHWFNDPTGSGYKVPTAAQVDRSIRWYDNDGDPSTASVKGITGNPTKPVYRDGTDDLFDKPYRGSNYLSFLGEESHAGTDEGPDLRIDAAAGGGQAAFLEGVNNALFPGYPSPNQRARITRIEVYSPPLIDIAGQKTRFGIATVKVTAGVFLYPGTAKERQVAQRVTKTVLAEVPYPGNFGPLTSCNYLRTMGDVSVHWGPIHAAGDFQFRVSAIDNSMDSSFPHAGAGAPGFPDAHITGAKLAAFLNAADNSIEDPWLRVKTGGQIHDSSGSPLATQDVQPFPFSCTSPGDPDCTDRDHSNVFQNLGFSTIPCPELDYAFWRQVALSGTKNTHYYRYASGGNFRMKGSPGGSLATAESATAGKTGFFFFDTADGQPPTDVNGDGIFDNLTEDVVLTAGWNSGGFIYLNTRSLSSQGLGNFTPARTMYAPGEPWVESNGIDGWQSGETVLHIGYPVTDPTAMPRPTFTKLGTTTTSRIARGPSVSAMVHMAGVIYNSGYWNVKGNGKFFGSVITKQGIIEGGGAPAGSPDIWFDVCLKDGCWPPPYLELPRVVPTSWESDM